ncbi:unnamed protein product [Ambrosiozyma monospora]|uniref:ATPase synthesis protein 25 n=1 Tax=Ambrosiozyma monospora TaxID=43982 RepID=A0A9W7DDZ6_AMBMO|nr:unnamed protein product [Ambrosiozyma monospora]
MTDINVFDLRGDNSGLVNEGAQDVADFMIIGTGKSSRHLQKAANELTYFVKHELNQVPSAEGLVSTGQLAKFQRRLLKKGKKAPNYAKFDYGSPANTWVMMDCKTDDIYVHFLTAERREDLNLEGLWATDKEKYKKKQRHQENDDIFAGVRYLHTSRRPTTILQMIKQLKQMSTNAATQFDPTILTRENYNGEFEEMKKLHLSNPENYPLKNFEHHFKAMQANGLPLTTDDIISYIGLCVQSPEFSTDRNRPLSVLNKRYDFVVNLLNVYAPHLTTKDVEKLLPVLVVIGSQIDDDRFVTLDKLSDPAYKVPTTEDGRFFQFPITDRLHNLTNLTNIIHYKGRNSTDSHSQLELLLFTIFINGDDTQAMRAILDRALERMDFELMKATIPLIASRGDVQFHYTFLTTYMPILVKSDGFEVGAYKRWVGKMLEKLDSGAITEIQNLVKL